MFYFGVAAPVFLIANLGYVFSWPQPLECGRYGFICERNNRVRLCEGENLYGPTFICPPDTICNKDSNDVCENAINYIDSTFTRTVKCHRNERIADPNVPDCKGYILCIPNKNRFQGIKFQCSGKTIFNGYTRSCTSPEKYKCPLTNTTKSTPPLYDNGNRRGDTYLRVPTMNNDRSTLDCKDYKFTVTQDNSPNRATYFCPSRPVRGETSVRCTIFSNQFCITLLKDDEDQFMVRTGTAYRRPRS